MAKIIGTPTRVTVEAQFIVSEVELRAMQALAGYGTDAFLRVFYEHLGEAYLKEHEAGLRSLFDAFREETPPILSRVTAARKVVENAEKESAQRRGN